MEKQKRISAWRGVGRPANPFVYNKLGRPHIVTLGCGASVSVPLASGSSHSADMMLRGRLRAIADVRLMYARANEHVKKRKPFTAIQCRSSPHCVVGKSLGKSPGKRSETRSRESSARCGIDPEYDRSARCWTISRKSHFRSRRRFDP